MTTEAQETETSILIVDDMPDNIDVVAGILKEDYKVRAATEKEWILYVTGALSVLFGILVIMQPAAGGVTIVYMVASWAILIGLLKVFFAFKIKNIPDAIGERLGAGG